MKKVLQYVQKNWFTVGIVAILVVAIFKKDFSFRINLNTPAKEAVPEEKAPSEQEAQKPSKELYTENSGGNTPKTSIFDRFDFSPLGKEKKEAPQEIEAIQQLDDELKNAFIKRFAHVAIQEREKYGIPSSIIIANALLHSQAGISTISATANNYFQLPCTAEWQGQTKTVDKRCFRVYENAWTSFRDFSLYVTTGKFSRLRTLSPTDFTSWAQALEEEDFSRLPQLSRQLLFLIEEYSLSELDQ